MILQKNNLFFFLILTGLLFQCSQPLDVHAPVDSYKYFPLTVGEERSYEIIRTSYAVGQKVQTDTLLTKETVQSVKEQNGSKIYQVLRMVRGRNDLFFKPEASFQYIYSPESVVNTEKNLNQTILRFPLYVGAEWNLNENNLNDKQTAQIVYTSELPAKLLTNENIYKVEVEDLQSNINFKRIYQLYSKNIGLIYSEHSEIEYCQDENCIGKFIIQSGQREYKRLLEYKKVN